MVLGQVKCADKSNEMTAIPELLKIIEITGCLVTIEAMGCQKEIVRQIVKKEVDYVISLKGNQGTLQHDIKDYLDWAERIKFKDIEFDYHQTLEKGHGRIEQRRCWVTEEIDWFLFSRTIFNNFSGSTTRKNLNLRRNTFASVV